MGYSKKAIQLDQRATIFQKIQKMENLKKMDHNSQSLKIKQNMLNLILKTVHTKLLV